MSHLKYTTPAGFGQNNLKSHKYNQVVRVDNVLHISGQSGYKYENGEFFEDVDEQIDQTFANIDHILKEAGGKGWEQVFRVNSYHISLDDRAQNAMVRNFEKWMPNHKSLWTCVEVGRLGGGDVMKVEIEVQAHLGGSS